MRRLLVLSLSVCGLLSCRKEFQPRPVVAVDPPVTTIDGIPDAPVSGRIHGQPFMMRDARYVADRRVGYAHTDIELSAGTAETACGPLVPGKSTRVWLRQEGADRVETMVGRVGPGTTGKWSVHYQVFDGEFWVGAGDGSALLTMHEPGPDGRIQGGIAACFSDDDKSCVSGSFNAVACPSRLDLTVRGTLPPETMPAAALKLLGDAGRK